MQRIACALRMLHACCIYAAASMEYACMLHVQCMCAACMLHVRRMSVECLLHVCRCCKSVGCVAVGCLIAYLFHVCCMFVASVVAWQVRNKADARQISTHMWHVDRVPIGCGPSFDRMWTKFRSDVNRVPIGCGPSFDRMWTEFRSDVDRVPIGD